MIVVLVIVSLANYGHLIIVHFFHNKITFAILYHVISTYDDREPSFMETHEQ